MDRETLTSQARDLETYTYYPMGRYEDGAVYTALGRKVWDFMRQASAFLGDGDWEKGSQIIRAKVEARKLSGEMKADPDCGNWQLWIIFNELGVSRVGE